MAKKIKKPATVPVETLKFTAKERAAFKADALAKSAAAKASIKPPVAKEVEYSAKVTVKAGKVVKIDGPKARPTVAEEAADFLKASLEIDEPVSAPVVVAPKPKPIPVEGDKPGTAREPKPKKIVHPVKFDADQDQNLRISVLEVHLAKLLERLSAEHGGVHTVAAEALRADTAKANAK